MQLTCDCPCHDNIAAHDDGHRIGDAPHWGAASVLDDEVGDGGDES